MEIELTLKYDTVKEVNKRHKITKQPPTGFNHKIQRSSPDDEIKILQTRSLNRKWSVKLSCLDLFVLSSGENSWILLIYLYTFVLKIFFILSLSFQYMVDNPFIIYHMQLS